MVLLGGQKTGIEKKFLELCEGVVKECGLELYDLSYLPGGQTLRIFILKKETATAELADCARVDKALTPFFETQEWMPETITLEVSSPGLFRKLNTIAHFQAVVGKEVSVTFSQKLKEREYPKAPKELLQEKKRVSILKLVREDGLGLEYKGFAFFVPFEQISKANLEADLSERE